MIMTGRDDYPCQWVYEFTLAMVFPQPPVDTNFE